ncbi:phage head-tail adapter protein [Brevundimonas sp. SPF441]|uniref:phage head-tail adapter protein n=1 Tax=Brevundimonas sp. SPF441 TaxID=2663795 RepID=UPI001415C070|nr:phage head-tail adapter protein [Brevundimonas sp. SPF441]
MRTLAGLFQPVEAETPYGGRSVSFEAVGSAWLKCGARRRTERGEGHQRRAVETMGAEARADGRLTVGRVLRFGGADWRIVAMEDARPGRAKLDLERVR